MIPVHQLLAESNSPEDRLTLLPRAVGEVHDALREVHRLRVNQLDVVDLLQRAIRGRWGILIADASGRLLAADARAIELLGEEAATGCLSKHRALDGEGWMAATDHVEMVLYRHAAANSHPGRILAAVRLCGP